MQVVPIIKYHASVCRHLWEKKNQSLFEFVNSKNDERTVRVMGGHVKLKKKKKKEFKLMLLLL